MIKKEKKKTTRTQRRKRRFIENVIITVLLSSSLVLLSFPLIKNYVISNQTNSYQINKVTVEEIEENKEREVSYDWGQVQSLTPESIVRLQNAKIDLPVIGGITIPQLNINLPIFNGTSNEAMSFGSGTLSPSQMMGQGNYALASHHIFDVVKKSDLLFSPLEKAVAGQKIYITDKTSVWEYTITEKFIVSPEQVEVLDEIPNKKVITLITCTDLEATQRIIVRGELTAEYDYNDMPNEAVNGFNMEYKTF